MHSWNPDASHAQSGVPNAALIVGMHYAPYGYQPAAERAALLGFTGQCREPVTGGYLLGNGHRLYNPSCMRFASPDGLSPFGEGGVNAFAYCQGDPVNRQDSSGRAPRFFKSLFSSTSSSSTMPNEKQQSVQLMDLPNEVLIKTVEKMDAKTLKLFSMASKRAKAVVESMLESTLSLNFTRLDRLLAAQGSIEEQLLVLAKVSKGLTPISPFVPQYFRYSDTTIDNLIAKVNRAPYLPEINRVEEQQRLIRQRQDEQLSNAYRMVVNGRGFI